MEIKKINFENWQGQLQNSVVNISQLKEHFKSNLNSNNCSLYNDIESKIKNENIDKVIEKYPMRITPYYLSLIKEVGDPIWKQAIPDPVELSNLSSEFTSEIDIYDSDSDNDNDNNDIHNKDSIYAYFSNYLNHNNVLLEDPLHEESQSPVPSIIHRYPDRVIFLVSNQCAMYCRHCMRKRKVGLGMTTYDKEMSFCKDVGYDKKMIFCKDVGYDKWGEYDNEVSYDKMVGYKTALKDNFNNNNSYISLGLNYIKKNKRIRDVILSGGDPLMLSTEAIDKILFAIRQIEHVETIRIHTRVICTLPFRITNDLATVFEKYHPLYINTHFNHPLEITDQAASACSTLVRAGVPLGCQTVLLKGVNDNPDTIIELMRKLIRIRVKPYYLHHPDPVSGTAHFRPSLDVGLRIMRAMRGNLTGIAIPQYMIDLPGGYGKVPLLPNYIKGRNGNIAIVENYEGKNCMYNF